MGGLSSDAPPPPQLCFSSATGVPAGESRFSVLSFFSLLPLPSPVLAGVSTSPGCLRLSQRGAGSVAGAQTETGGQRRGPPAARLWEGSPRQAEPLPVGRVPQGLQGAAGPEELIYLSAVV